MARDSTADVLAAKNVPKDGVAILRRGLASEQFRVVQVLGVVAVLECIGQRIHAAFLRTVALQAGHDRRYQLIESVAGLVLREAKPLTDLLHCSTTACV